MVRAEIIAAGFGVRLVGEWSGPKGMIEAGGKPIVGEALEQLEKMGLQTLLVSNERDVMAYREFVRKAGWQNVALVSNGARTKEESRGAVHDMWVGMGELGQDQDILVLPCDTVLKGTLDLGKLVEFARRKPGVTVVARREDRELIRNTWGNLVVDEGGRVTQFIEKPAEPVSDLAAAAIYYYPAAELEWVRRFLEEGREGDNPGRMIPYLLEKERPLFAYVVESGMVDVGTPEDLRVLSSS